MGATGSSSCPGSSPERCPTAAWPKWSSTHRSNPSGLYSPTWWRRHELTVRYWRAPTGIVVDVEERGVPTGQGYQFSVLGAHDADIRMLTSLALARAEDEIGRLHLEPSGSGWTLVGDEVTGRFVWDTSSPRVTPTPW